MSRSKWIGLVVLTLILTGGAAAPAALASPCLFFIQTIQVQGWGDNCAAAELAAEALAYDEAVWDCQSIGADGPCRISALIPTREGCYEDCGCGPNCSCLIPRYTIRGHITHGCFFTSGGGEPLSTVPNCELTDPFAGG